MPFKPFGKDLHVSLTNLQDEMNHLFERMWHSGVSAGPFDGQEWAPALDVAELPRSYVVTVEVPGVDAAAIDVSFLGQTMTIRGSKPAPNNDESDQRAIHRERRFGTFMRTIDLPTEVQEAHVSAKCKGGVLEVTVPKAEGSMPKAIRVDVVE